MMKVSTFECRSPRDPLPLSPSFEIISRVLTIGMRNCETKRMKTPAAKAQALNAKRVIRPAQSVIDAIPQVRNDVIPLGRYAPDATPLALDAVDAFPPAQGDCAPECEPARDCSGAFLLHSNHLPRARALLDFVGIVTGQRSAVAGVVPTNRVDEGIELEQFRTESLHCAQQAARNRYGNQVQCDCENSMMSDYPLEPQPRESRDVDQSRRVNSEELPALYFEDLGPG